MDFLLPVKLAEYRYKLLLREPHTRLHLIDAKSQRNLVVSDAQPDAKVDNQVAGGWLGKIGNVVPILGLDHLLVDVRLELRDRAFVEEIRHQADGVVLVRERAVRSHYDVYPGFLEDFPNDAFF